MNLRAPDDNPDNIPFSAPPDRIRGKPVLGGLINLDQAAASQPAKSAPRSAQPSRITSLAPLLRPKAGCGEPVHRCS